MPRDPNGVLPPYNVRQSLTLNSKATYNLACYYAQAASLLLVDEPEAFRRRNPGLPPVAELASLGVRRISVGQAFAFAGLGAVVEAARELLEDGTYGFMEFARTGGTAARSAFSV